MIKSIVKKVFLSAGAFACMFALPLAVASGTARADNIDQVNKGIDLVDGGANKSSDLSPLIKKIIDLLSYIIGIVAVLMIILGGLRYILSGGDSNSISGAKNTILYALIGIVIVIFAQVIVRFVVNGVSDTKTPSTSTTPTP